MTRTYLYERTPCWVCSRQLQEVQAGEYVAALYTPPGYPVPVACHLACAKVAEEEDRELTAAPSCRSRYMQEVNERGRMDWSPGRRANPARRAQ